MGDGVVLCYHCNEPCTSDYINAMDKAWHADHFNCKTCDSSLAGKPFYEHESHGYCQTCYEKQCAPKCSCCGEGIIGDVTTALGKTWKPSHFVCTHCKKNFSSGEGFLEKEDMPYCKPDYYELFKPKCCKCNMPIIEKTVMALEQKWHPNCFVCSHSKCGKEFVGGRFFVIDTKPYCTDHKSGEKEKDDANDPVYAKFNHAPAGQQMAFNRTAAGGGMVYNKSQGGLTYDTFARGNDGGSGEPDYDTANDLLAGEVSSGYCQVKKLGGDDPAYASFKPKPAASGGDPDYDTVPGAMAGINNKTATVVLADVKSIEGDLDPKPRPPQYRQVVKHKA